VPYLEIALDLGGARGDRLTYSVPQGSDDLSVGSLVLVSVRGRRALGVVLRHVEQPEFETNDIDGLASTVSLSPSHLELASWIAEHYRARFFECLRLCLPPGLESRLKRDSTPGQSWPPRPEDSDQARPAPAQIFLSRDQRDACEAVRSGIRGRQPLAFLLHGVTGSGKTHVFLEAADEALRLGTQVLILVSDISLTPELVGRIDQRFPGEVGVLHSSIAEGARAKTWRAIHDGQIKVVVGTRSALFAPAHQLGLVVIDEEHEPSYKQEASPRYHARDTAIQLGRLARVPVLLSSATPDIVSYYRAEQEEYRLLSLPDRVGDTRQGQVVRAPLPDVEVVDMRREARAGNVGLISRSLLEHLQRTLDRGLQALLFLNRRGSATALTCRSCGRAVECRRCSIAMGYHESRDLLICHRCGRTRESPTACPQCGERLSALGAGVQKVESEVRKKLPSARVIRWDRDTTSKRGSHEAIWRSFSEHDADILIGTQMVGKGLDFPDVGLVGIVLAESQLFLPDYRAAERTFEILTQVAGRAGRRSDRVGQVLLQTYVPNHYVIRAAARQDYLDLYRRELAFRRQQAYPPFRPLIRLVNSASNSGKAQDEATRVGRLLVEEATRLGLSDVQIIGPAPSFIVRLRGRYRWHIVMAGSEGRRVLDAVSLGPEWIVDVDPMDTL
jgi:primosomal protein N' (replication factor Y) (superfamily II helicase)